MDNLILTLIIAAVGLAVGIGLGYLLGNKNGQKNIESAQLKADAVLKEAQIKADGIHKERILQAKETVAEMQKKANQEDNDHLKKMEQGETRLKQKEQTLNQSTEQLKKEQARTDGLRNNLTQQMEGLNRKTEEIEKLKKNQVEALEKLAGMSADEAKQKMMEALTDEARTLASGQIREIIEQSKLTATKEAKRIVIQTIQRTAAEHAIENTVSVFPLENDEIKGRIIGREGRNIRALEAATGVEIIVDDTPETIILSAFDPIRREIARLSLHKLVQDGRIHPARIEEVVLKMTKQINEEIMETGERTIIELGIHGLAPDLIRMVGRMKYRSSYGQNLLHHSKEVARLCATMASELGLNAKMAKRAGLLHDIGKVPEDQPELPHALLGMELAIKYKENAEICNAIGAHHDEIEMTTLLAPIVQACDAISGSRPGARREMVENYIKRLKELEGVGMNYPGVTKSYAIQAGRELRVIVESEKISDEQSDVMAFDIATKIQNEMQYPGQIKVTVIREKRAVAYAK